MPVQWYIKSKQKISNKEFNEIFNHFFIYHTALFTTTFINCIIMYDKLFFTFTTISNNHAWLHALLRTISQFSMQWKPYWNTYGCYSNWLIFEIALFLSHFYIMLSTEKLVYCQHSLTKHSFRYKYNFNGCPYD